VKLQNVLILHKKSTFEIQARQYRDARFLKLMQEGHEAISRVKLAHDEHMETLAQLEKELSARGVKFESVARADMQDHVTDVDMIVAVGGDGTFLDASHHVTDVPVLGVNSSVHSSFGHFCLANKDTLSTILDQIENDTLQPKKILRLEMSVNGSPLPELVLNEVLVAHANPAATSRYFIGIGDIREEQRSSGLWIGTPGGSTGSLRSAGAKVLPITDHEFEYIVREPCTRPGQQFKLMGGILGMNDEIAVISQMRTGNLYIDGQHIDYQLGLGDEVIVKPSKTFLNSYIAEDVNDIFL
jgi:NAD+ kinase